VFGRVTAFPVAQTVVHACPILTLRLTGRWLGVDAWSNLGTPTLVGKAVKKLGTRVQCQWLPCRGGLSIYPAHIVATARCIVRPKKEEGRALCAAFDYSWLRGWDLNQRPSGYESTITH
jgi:hypothetical protein